MKLSDQIGEILYQCNGTGAGANLVTKMVKKKMKEYAISYVEMAANRTTFITSEEILKLKTKIKKDRL